MSKNTKIVWIVVIVVAIAIVAFYTGMNYGKGSVGLINPGANFSARTGQLGSSTGKGGNRVAFGGAVMGQILSVDANSLTVSVQGGGSRIVFLSASTTVNKVSASSVKDLIVGSNVSINGVANPDNSINAQGIQIRPTMPIK